MYGFEPRPSQWYETDFERQYRHDEAAAGITPDSPMEWWENEYKHEKPCDCDAGFTTIASRDTASDGSKSARECNRCKRVWLHEIEG